MKISLEKCLELYWNCIELRIFSPPWPHSIMRPPPSFTDIRDGVNVPDFFQTGRGQKIFFFPDFFTLIHVVSWKFYFGEKGQLRYLPLLIVIMIKGRQLSAWFCKCDILPLPAGSSLFFSTNTTLQASQQSWDWHPLWGDLTVTMFK